MIDINLIRHKYSSMTDDQLIHLAREDSYGLTDEAIQLLKQELKRRNLDIDVFIASENDQKNEDNEEREPITGFYNPATGADDALLGRNYLSIQNPAKEKELEESESKWTASLSQTDLNNLIQKCNISMIINGIIFIAGIAVTLITFLAASEKGGTFYIAWGAIVFGGFKFFRAFEQKNKYRSILKNAFFEFENEKLQDPDAAEKLRDT